MSFLDVAGIHKQLGAFALKNISFSQQKFQRLAIAGETGSGKSTLLKIIAGLIQPDGGTVSFEGVRVPGPFEQLIPGHPGIAYLSQHYELRNNYRMEELLEYANKLPDKEAVTLYRLCRIDHLFKRKNDQLSGGEKQRIALARLLVSAPKLLLLDEPFSNLDPIHKNILKTVLEDIGEHLQITSILTSHDPLDTLSWADTLLVIRDGGMVQQGSPQVIYYHPVDEYAAGLFGNYNTWNKNGIIHYLRPEALSLVPEVVDAVKGIVLNTRFWGSYYEIEVMTTGQQTLLVRTTSNTIAKGDTVFLSLPPALR